MEITAKRWFQIKEILFITLFWTLAVEIFIFVRFFGWDMLGEDTVVFLIPFSFGERLLIGGIGGLIIGLLTGIFEILLVTNKLSHRSFGQMVGIKAFVYLLVIIGVLSVVRLLIVNKFQNDLFEDSLSITGNPLTYLPFLIYCIFISILIGVLLQVNKKFGPGILWSLFLGKYHRPKEEERIFMFLDLTSSTTIAEKLGHVKYSRLLQDCFQDLSDILLDHRAHIYQFVGDEAVLTWTMQSGLYNGNCIRIYYAFEKQLKSRERHYLHQYDHFPKFKASLNIGMVSVAEVGDIKSEIAYHGDVLNTGARILEQCNLHQKGLLISGALETRLDNPKMSSQFMSKIQLRGKAEEVQIFSIDYQEN